MAVYDMHFIPLRAVFLHPGIRNAAFSRLKWLQQKLRKTVSQPFFGIRCRYDMLGHRVHPTGRSVFAGGLPTCCVLRVNVAESEAAED